MRIWRLFVAQNVEIYNYIGKYLAEITYAIFIYGTVNLTTNLIADKCQITLFQQNCSASSPCVSTAEYCLFWPRAALDEVTWTGTCSSSSYAAAVVSAWRLSL